MPSGSGKTEKDWKRIDIDIWKLSNLENGIFLLSCRRFMVTKSVAKQCNLMPIMDTHDIALSVANWNDVHCIQYTHSIFIYFMITGL